jgi:hypothetical protein
VKLIRTIGATAVIAISIAGFAVSGADADSREPEFSVPTVGEWVAENGVAAARALNPELTKADIAQLRNDPTARMTESGKILFVDPIRENRSPLAASIPQNVTSIPLANFDTLNSRPGSDRTIFIDFDGHTVPVGTLWDHPSQLNPTVAGVYPAFSMDGSVGFSDIEKQAIINAWAAVAEDYAMFDVNVTTEDPGPDAIDRTTSSDPEFGTRALVTPGNASWNSSNGSCKCQGIAYLGVFNEAIDLFGLEHEEWQPAFVFMNIADFTNPSLASAAAAGKFISDVVSHEVGHNLNLRHDGSFEDSNGDGIFLDEDPKNEIDDVTGDVLTAYFEGIGDGKNWAPIMGAGYYNGVVQWSNGDYGTTADPASNEEDDVSIISASGIQLLSDEANNSTATALALSYTALDAVIGSRTDVDWYKVTVTAGSIGIYAGPPTPNTNLDIKLSLLDGGGNVVFSTDALSSMTEANNGDGTWPVAGMDGIINVDLPNGTYYITIDGVGRAGAYSDYGSVGSYSIKSRAPTVSSIASQPKPTISGTKRKGRTLTANYGTWSSGTSFTKQWLRDGVAITGATKKSYVLKTADVGHKISVRLVGTKAGKRIAVKVSSKTTRITR